VFYSDLYRRHLLDMHIDDWNPEFLSQFSPEAYVENLKKAQINYAMIYLQSHAGLCYYPTKTGVMHKALKKQPDLIRRVVDLCHENGIKVCGYYSLIYNTREHDRHPEWRMVVENGRSRRENMQVDKDLAFTNPKTPRYGFCCPNNPAYLDFVKKQIDEMLAYFACDGIFFDMPFWAHTCYCAHCREAFGAPIPLQYNREIIEFKTRQMGKFIQAVTAHVKSINPDMPVSHNYAQAIAGYSNMGTAEEVLAACDYVGGDLYGDLYNHSFACKFYKNATPNQPFEQMFSRCKPALRMHTLTKSPDEMKTAVASTMAHHGATMVIDAIDPVGTMDQRVYHQVGDLFSFQEAYEPWFQGEMIEQVGLYYGIRSRVLGDPVNAIQSCANANKTLARAHIPFGVTGSYHNLDAYPILAAPMLSAMEEKDNPRLIAYVRNGGTLYLSGCGNAKLVEELTGNRFISVTEETNLYVAPAAGYEEVFGGFNAKYPLPFELAAPVVEANGAQVIATLTFPYTKPDEIRYASIHSDPPGVPTAHPAVTVNSYGKGTVIWSALPVEFIQYEEYRQIFLNLLHLKGKPEYFFCSDAPRHVELTAFQNTDSITVNAVVMDEETVSAPVAPFTIKVRTQAKSVKLLPSGEDVPFAVEGEHTVFKTRKLQIFDMYEIR